MAGIEYKEIRQRLTPEARALLLEMVEVHLAGSGDREFLHSTSFGGSDLQFFGTPCWTKADPDAGALDDLEGYGLLRLVRIGQHSTRTFRVPGEAIHFYNWLMEEEGSPVDQIEVESLRLVEGDAFAKHHPGAAIHLGEALKLLRSSQAVTDQVSSEIGSHLRGAVFDFAADLTNKDGDTERPLLELKNVVAASQVNERERRVLVSLLGLLETVLSLDQRVTHVRDEKDKGRPLRGWDEVRRAVFTTVFVCSELDQTLRVQRE